MEGEPLRIWIDDSHPVFRRGVTAILTSAGFTVTGESAGLQPIPDVDKLDILIFEAEGTGVADAARLANDTPVRMIAVIRKPDDRAMVEAIEAGAAAVLLRSDLDPVGLISSLRSASVGNTSLPAGLLPRVLEGAASRRSGNGGSRALTERELAVLRYLAEGDDTNQIAAQMSYSARTVKNIVHDVLMKMNCRNRVHAVAQATRQGLI